VIFVTIGSLFPFDRLIELTDALAPTFSNETFFAQIGDGAYEPRNMPFARLLPRMEFLAKVQACKLIVAHAGMGSVITAMDIGRPIVLLPRIRERGEHTTDHQLATARWLEDRRGIHVCMDETTLGDVIRSALGGEEIAAGMTRTAPEGFIRQIRDFIESA